MTDPTADFSTRDENTHLFDANAPATGEPDRLPTVPGYQILGVLGRGGMSVVYKAQQQQPNRVVALKMILRGAHASAQERLRFLQEAEAVAALRHPNIVEIHEVGQLDGVPYFTLEYISGGSLADKTRNEPLAPKAAAEVMEPVVRAVAAAHAAGFAHRDLKPDNVLLTAPLTAEGLPAGGQPSWGTPKVTDFGLAKRLAVDSSLTQTGAIFGTPSYMAPEQAQGSKTVGPAADVWSLGATLYKLVTGRPPFLGATPLETCGLVLNAEPVTPSQLVVGMPRDLETICLKCLQKDVAKRYASATELADDLRRFLNGESILARPVGPFERAGKWVKRNPVVAAMLAVVFVALTTASIVSTAFALKAADRERKAEEAAIREGERADEARRAVEQGKDALCRSLFEQGRSFRQSRSPGRSRFSLDLFHESVQLRNRLRPDGIEPSAELPTEIALRSEAIAALSQTDLRLVRMVPITGQSIRLSGNGRFALMDKYDASVSANVESRFIDLTTGTVAPERFPVTANEPEQLFLATANELEHHFLDTTGKRSAYAPVVGERPIRTAVHIRELPSGKTLVSLPWPRDPDRGLVVLAWSTDVAFHGDRLAMAKLDEEALWVLLWDLAKPEKPIRTYRFPNPDPTPRQSSNLIAFHPDGSKLLVELPTGKTGVVAADGTGEPVVYTAPGLVMRWFPNKPWWLVFLPAGDGLVHPAAWDYMAGKEIFRLPPWSASAAVTLVENPPRLVAGTPNGTLKSFDMETGRELSETPVLHPREVTHFRTLPDGQVCTVSRTAGELRVWDSFNTLTVQHVFPVPAGTDHVAAIPDSELFVAARLSSKGVEAFRTSHIIDSRSGRSLRTWQNQVTAQASVGLSGGRVLKYDGLRLFGLDQAKGQRAAVVKAVTGEELLERYAIDFGDPVYGVGAWDLVEHEGRVLYPAYHPNRHDRKAVVIWDMLSGKEVQRLTHPELVRAGDPMTRDDWLVVTPDGRYLFVTTLGRANQNPSTPVQTEIWDVATGARVNAIPSPNSGFISLKPNANGRWASAWVSGLGETGNEIRVYALPSGEVKLRIAGSDLTERRAIDRQGRYLALARANGDVWVHDLDTGHEVFRWLSLDSGPVRQLVFTREGRLVALSETGATVRVLNIPAVQKELTARGLGW